jgi:predicted cation transporter
VPTSTESFFSDLFFCLINIGQSYIFSVSVCSGVAFQPAHCIVSLKNLAAASIPSTVLRETFKVNLSLMRCVKSFQFVCLLLKLGCFFWFSACTLL